MHRAFPARGPVLPVCIASDIMLLFLTWKEAKWGWGQHPACPRLSRADLEADAEDWAQVGCGTGVERGLAVGRGRGCTRMEEEHLEVRQVFLHSRACRLPTCYLLH